MTDELDKALEWADWINGVGYEVPKIISAKKGAEILAIAVRSLRETVKAREAEVARWKLSYETACSQIDGVDAELRDVVKENAALCRKLHEAGVNPSLDQALNENDGVYKP